MLLIYLTLLCFVGARPCIKTFDFNQREYNPQTKTSVYVYEQWFDERVNNWILKHHIDDVITVNYHYNNDLAYKTGSILYLSNDCYYD